MAKGSSNTILLLGAAGVAFYGYTQGWFNSILSSFGPIINVGGGGSSGTNPQLTAAQAAAIQAAAAKQGSAPIPPVATVPPLGTIVKNAGEVQAQAAAKDPYILPDAGTFTPYAMSPLPGYVAFGLKAGNDYSNVLLRQDVYDLANSTVSASGNPLSLTDLQALMKTKGLSGLGDYRRHLYTRGAI